MKLDATEAVLDWAQMQSDVVDQGHGYITYDTLVFTPDTETAARLALAMRVLAIVEKRVVEGASVDLADVDYWSGGNYDDAYSIGLDHGELGALRSIIAEASAEKGDK